MVKVPIILQIVGYQNSGKTTLVKKVIECLSRNGFAVATIKHHGHGGKPDIIDSKDSGQHIASGAQYSIVEGNGRLLLQAEKLAWTLQEQIRILESIKPDFIIIEGHKFEEYPKVVIIKEKEDRALLSSLENIKAVISWNNIAEEIQNTYSPISFFNFHDNKGLEWICQYLMKQLNK
ncbi:molybdopterin-guanine dinucleotide biosynthesis protein B [Bacillus sp. FJAT-49705]|uniref:Molybdopterin-guanine dinucleotide biosynthesis protein B n=1 Tax=Cytobacillus citreus TaxID=2833586 RepID=A0ABS5NM19_9BACI|nr:molybdopterin-guanine dinucleotide biosynthesis protein B [Cytobacillus citreus]MBS4188852.1 molybdopterin-guanine dinucleotide biosynthesis protein B [Cytobacillus citreus]